MKRELSDEEQRIVEAWLEYGKSVYSYGLGLSGMREEEDTGNRAFDALFQAITAIAKQQYAKGMAAGLLLAGRHDLIARDPDLEKAAAVIMAERLHRKDGNSQ